jgi:polar amino acid transport system substrate-binding protein
MRDPFGGNYNPPVMREATILALIVLATAGVSAQNSDVRQQLVPTGKLRAALNTGNPLTRAVGAEIARELARRLGVEVVLLEYPSPGAIIDAAGKEWDIGFVAADPDREGAVQFTSPYMELEATYLVPGDSPIKTTADVDRPGVRIATGATSAYTLVLKRDITRAELVFAGNEDAFKALQDGRVHAMAGLRFNAMQWTSRVPGSRVLADSFTSAQQAIAVPNGRPAARAYLESFIDEVRRSGMIGAAIQKTGLAGARVAGRR